MKFKTILFLLVIGLITSCSVTKRKYLPGYYINNESVVKNNWLGQSNNIQKCESKSQYINTINNGCIDNQQNVVVITQSVIAKSKSLTTYSPKARSPQQPYIFKVSNTLNKNYNDSLKNQTSNLDIGAKRGSEISILSSLIPILGLFLQSGIPSLGLAYFGLLFGLLFGLIASILGLILSIIAIIKILKNPDKFTGLGRAISGTILSILTFIAILVFLAGPQDMLFVVGIIAAVMGIIFAVNLLLKSKKTGKNKNIGINIIGILISLVLLALSILEISNFP